MSSWKRLERETAKALGGKRKSRGANFSESAPDIILPENSMFVYECKYRKSIPRIIRLALIQAKSYTKGRQIPVAIIKEKGMHGAVVCLSLKDWVDLHGNA